MTYLIALLMFLAAAAVTTFAVRNSIAKGHIAAPDYFFLGVIAAGLLIGSVLVFAFAVG